MISSDKILNNYINKYGYHNVTYFVDKIYNILKDFDSYTKKKYLRILSDRNEIEEEESDFNFYPAIAILNLFLQEPKKDVFESLEENEYNKLSVYSAMLIGLIGNKESIKLLKDKFMNKMVNEDLTKEPSYLFGTQESYYIELESYIEYAYELLEKGRSEEAKEVLRRSMIATSNWRDRITKIKKEVL